MNFDKLEANNFYTHGDDGIFNKSFNFFVINKFEKKVEGILIITSGRFLNIRNETISNEVWDEYYHLLTKSENFQNIIHIIFESTMEK